MNSPLSALLTALVFLPLFGHTQIPINNSQIPAAIEKSGQWFLKGKNITSASIGVHSGGENFTAHFGELDKGKGNRPDDNTLYEIASVTKTMTGYLLAKAVAEGRVRLKDPIQQYLDTPYPNLAFKGTPITVRHLATHTSGLPVFLSPKMNNAFTDKDPEEPFKFLALEQEYNKTKFLEYLANVTLTRKPGEVYGYSNAGTELVGLVLEKVYQQSIDEQLAAAFLEKTGMTNTAITLSPEQKEQLVQGYWMDNDRPSPNILNNLWATGSGVKSTLEDLMKYAALQLDDQDPITSQAQEILYDNGKGKRVAYLWDVSMDRYGTYYSHHGGTGGMQNWLFIFPKYDLGISIITNHSDYSTPTRLSKAARMILKEIVPD
jgi:CubicO group peptidase (beta-lactamase class C family)